MQPYRFVIVYRGERGTRDNKVVCWRGWIEQVFPEVEGNQLRHFFSDPDEISQIISDAVKHDSK